MELLFLVYATNFLNFHLAVRKTQSVVHNRDIKFIQFTNFPSKSLKC